MLFSNTILKVVDKMMNFGAVSGVTIGEDGRGRREVFLPTPKCVQTGDVIKGLRSDLTIGTSKSGRPRINASKSKDNDIYVVLSSERDYTRRGNGYVEALKSQELELIARGNGADGAAGRVGRWDAVILKAHEGDVFRVTWAGYEYGYEPTFYVVASGKVYVADQPEVEDLYESLGLDIPFSLSYDQDEGLVTALDEWQRV